MVLGPVAWSPMLEQTTTIAPTSSPARHPSEVERVYAGHAVLTIEPDPPRKLAAWRTVLVVRTLLRSVTDGSADRNVRSAEPAS